MKRLFVFLLGLIAGAAVTALLFLLIGSVKNKTKDLVNDNRITFFDEPGDVIDVKTFIVFQALDTGYALARQDLDLETEYSGLVVLLYNNQGRAYYDNQRVKIGRGQKFRQVGLYRYVAKDGNMKTVPIVCKVVEKK